MIMDEMERETSNWWSGAATTTNNEKWSREESLSLYPITSYERIHLWNWALAEYKEREEKTG